MEAFILVVKINSYDRGKYNIVYHIYGNISTFKTAQVHPELEKYLYVISLTPYTFLKFKSIFFIVVILNHAHPDVIILTSRLHLTFKPKVMYYTWTIKYHKK